MNTPQYDQAVEVRTAYDAAVRKVQTDPNLNFAGKQVSIAKLWVACDDRLTVLSEEEGQQSRRKALEQQLFGLPTNAPTADTVSYRDALDRVSNIDWQQQDAYLKLHAIYANAQISNDKILAKAVLSEAFTLGDSELISQFIDDNPALASSVAELSALRNNRPHPMSQMIYDVSISKPTEISALSELQIRSLADPKYAENKDAKAKDDFVTAWSSMFGITTLDPE